MKKLVLSAFASVLFLGLTSCSNNESLDNVELGTQGKLLKSYKLQKDVNGRYSIDYTLNDNTTSEVIKSNGTKEIYLYAGEFTGKGEKSEELSLENNQLSVDFVEDSQSKTSFVVEDENIVLAKGEKNNQFLQTYSLVSNGDNTFQLDFTVKEGISVEFVYNEKEGAYEINLKEGKTSNDTFTKTFVKDANDLKIDFINHTNRAAKGEAAAGPKRPRMIIVT
ncbi:MULTISPECIES: hypothetical protein [Tenacibaculum]|uniref:hypothetical protein n=1 Tax=Tenacibaculum TaxID=104267 RepID=UPI001F0AFF9C|nr:MULTISPECIES: hypothetical protein [Tenacibaculum]MCH3882877.1 hypothetical protein [Tenacibaculum aquimarinum]MCH3884414.1 hypothetical protein [Tenacibaculum aquimarinum]MDO6600414.1 hypothetical protein [Tenacibaculum sp. 1_MG-2023]